MTFTKTIERDVWCVLGLPFDAVTLTESVANIQQSIGDDEDCFLSTPNLNFAIASQSDDLFFQSVIDSDLSVADGMPLIWVAKLLGIPLKERVAGSTLFDELSKHKQVSNDINVFFFGGQEGVAELAHRELNKKSDAMKSCGFYDPGFVSVDEMSGPKILEYINDCKPDFIVVALGARKGQEWIQKNKDQLSAQVISHLGAVINFVAGNVERAPLVWQRLGMEWLWRIRQEPTLWKRYLFDGLAFLKLMLFNVLPLAVYDRVLKRRKYFKESLTVKVENQDQVHISLVGSIHHKNITMCKQPFSSILEEDQNNVVINCERLAYLDSAVIATMLLFQRCLSEQNRQLQIANAPRHIVRILRLNGVKKRFRLI